MTRVAIMQPTYLPWSGYFGLMQAVDVFVLLDSVQFSRRSWQQRNQIKTASGAQWLSVPVLSKGKREQLICEVEIDRSRDFEIAHRRSIELNYAKAPFFREYAADLLAMLSNPSLQLADLTADLIALLRTQLGIETRLIRSSALNGSGAKADLLASLCLELGATCYISPPGSHDYLDDSDAFAKLGIPIAYFAYQHPVYSQPHGEFLPYMSVIDMLFNCGPASLDIIRKASGIEP